MEIRLKSTSTDIRVPCEQLETRASIHWNSGLFTGCHEKYTITHDGDVREHIIGIVVNTSKSPFTSALAQFELKWLVNKLLNWNSMPCQTVAGQGDFDDVDNRPYMADDVPLTEFVLSAPVSTQVCSEIVNRTFADGQILVTGCHLEQTGRTLIYSRRIGKYILTVERRLHNMVPFEVTYVYIFFVNELNARYYGCQFNGYWAQIVFHSESHSR
ncbi:hypothetical protein EG68_03094 [Paragonimus skrjabini miyazakii]|uniref:Uncharacterized protein n=1 Tax=Paragonimus skrjabini miyazakii TaxID=59628 RepID=A0A8S9YYF3_9TREM|nr:hypothetical protein EG68_03094 [Paragonimus skrjabini miyazakii]